MHNLYDTIRKVILFFTISYINRNESVFLISYLKVFIIMFSIFHDIFTMFALKLPCCVFLISADENKSIVKWKLYIAKFFFYLYLLKNHLFLNITERYDHWSFLFFRKVNYYKDELTQVTQALLVIIIENHEDVQS